MRISVFICDSSEAMLEQEAEIGGGGTTLYKTPDAQSETGEIMRYFVRPPRSPGATLDRFAGKYLLIALI
jgi:hypothetical protein